MNLIEANEEELFLSHLRGVSDPEKKEKPLVSYLLMFLKKTQTNWQCTVFNWVLFTQMS